MPALDEGEPPDRLGHAPLEAELGGVVQHQDRAGGRIEPGLGGVEVPTQDDALIDAWVIEEPVGGLGGSPVLAGHRDGAADPLAQVGYHLPQSLLQPLVGKTTAQFVFDPGVHVGASRRVPER
jgi:hypothetical protein